MDWVLLSKKRRKENRNPVVFLSCTVISVAKPLCLSSCLVWKYRNSRRLVFLKSCIVSVRFRYMKVILQGKYQPYVHCSLLDGMCLSNVCLLSNSSALYWKNCKNLKHTYSQVYLWWKPLTPYFHPLITFLLPFLFIFFFYFTKFIGATLLNKMT